MKKIRMIAIAAALVCLGNLAVGSSNLFAATAGGCTKGCASYTACGTGCVCFPNPFDEFPEPGQCTR